MCAPQRLEGTPDEPVPEAVAGQLQPFVSRLQKDGDNGRWNLGDCVCLPRQACRHHTYRRMCQHPYA